MPKLLLFLHFLVFVVMMACSKKSESLSDAVSNSEIPFDSVSFLNESKNAVTQKIPFKLDSTGLREIKDENIKILKWSVVKGIYDDSEGITVSFDVSIGKDVFENLKKSGNSGYMLKVENDLLHYTSSPLYINKPLKQNIQLHIPYRELLLAQGNKELPLFICFYKTAKAIQDSLMPGISETKGNKIKPVSKYGIETEKGKITPLRSQSDPFGVVPVYIKDTFPVLYNVTIDLASFTLDTLKIKPSKCDFSFNKVPVFGKLTKDRSVNGYPDLCWKITSGNVLYASEVIDNVTEYIASSKATFVCTKRDKLKLGIFDKDVFFDDLIAEKNLELDRLRFNVSHYDSLTIAPVKKICLRSEIKNPQLVDTYSPGVPVPQSRFIKTK